MFASQEKIDTARENELDSLANSLANLRANFSDAAKEKDYLHTVSEAYGESRSEESVLRIKELLREPESRRRVLSELRAFSNSYVTDRSLLEHRPTISLPALIRQTADLDKPVTEFKAVDGFAPAKATFITEDEIDQFLADGPSLQDSKIRIYSYFIQGHDAKECAALLRHEYGDSGHVSEGWQTWSDGKGIKLTRSDENGDYDTVHLNWNQAQKRMSGEPEQLLATVLKAAHKPGPAPEPEQVEIDGGRIAEPPAPKTPMTSQVVGRVNAGAFDVVFEELHVGPELHNFHITDEGLGTGGQKTKYQNNVAAIRTLKQIEAEGRLAARSEQEILSHYVGWGSLAPAFDEHNKAWAKEFAELQSLLTPEEYAAARATTLSAHYTSPRVIKAIYDAVGRMGFQPGNILEPSCGIGNFFGLLPEALSGANLYGVELDSLTGRIARQLYQKAHITVDGFENTDHPDDFFDLAVGNVPFGSYKVHDRRYDRHNLQIHDYFLMKTLDKLRPGGIMAVITSKGTMDKKNSKDRCFLQQSHWRMECEGQERGQAGQCPHPCHLWHQAQKRLCHF